MGIQSIDAAYSIDQAKVEIAKKPDLKDLVGKPFDKLTTTNIHDLGGSVSGTVILLHALADRSPSMLGGSKKIDKFDIQKLYLFQNISNKEEGRSQLQHKITAMKVVIANFGDQIQDPTTKKFVEDFRELTADTQKKIEATGEGVRNDTDKLQGTVEQSMASQADMIAQMEYNPQSFKILKELKVDPENLDRTQGIVDFISSAIDTDNNGRADMSADGGARDWLMRKFNKNRDTGRQGAAFGEMQLYNILSNLPAQRLGELAKAFTSSETLDAKNGKEFNKNLQEKAMNLNNAAQLITGDSKAQGDLFALLNGKQDIYLANLLAQHTANLTKQSTQPGFTQKLQSALEKVGIPTNGQSLLDQSKQFLLAQGASLVYDNAFLSASTKYVNVGSSTHEPLSLQLGKGEVNAQAGLWYGVDLKNLLSGNSPLTIGAKADFNLNDNISRIINDGKALQDTVLKMQPPINEADILKSFGKADDIYYKQAKEAIAQFNKPNASVKIERLAGLLGDLKVNQGVSDSAGWSTKGLTAGINFLSPKFLQLGLTFSKLSQTYETRANEVESQAARDTNQVDVSTYEKRDDGLFHRADGIRYQENADKSRIYMFDGQIDFRAMGGGAGLTTNFENGVTLITVPANKELKVRNTIDNQVNGKIIQRLEIKLVDRKIDATAAQPVATVSPVDIVADTLDVTSAKEIMEALFKSTSSLSTVEIRRKYADLQNKAQEALQSGSSEKIQAIMDDPQMRKLLGSLPPTDVTEQAHALESMLGGMSGDWRYRILRAAQAGGDVDMKRVREALYSVRKTDEKFYTVHDLDTPGEIKKALSNLTMKDIYRMLDVKDGSNEKFTQTMMTEIGINSDVFTQARLAYRESAKGDHLNDKTMTKAGGIGYVINHQVLDGRKEPTFAGRQPVTADSLVRATPPVEFSGDVDRAKFVQSLSPLQMNTLKSGLETALGKADMSMDDIKTALTSNSDVTPEFYYAEYPNCTNAMVIMKLSVKGKPVDLTADFNDGLTGTAATADVRNHAMNVTAGVVEKIKKDTPPPPGSKPPEDITNTTTIPQGPADPNATTHALSTPSSLPSSPPAQLGASADA